MEREERQLAGVHEALKEKLEQNRVIVEWKTPL